MGNVFQDFTFTNFSDFQIVIFPSTDEVLLFFLSGQGFAAIEIASLLLLSFYWQQKKFLNFQIANISNFLNKACNLKFFDCFQIFWVFLSFSEFNYLYWPTKLFKCCRRVTGQNSIEKKWIWTFFPDTVSKNFSFSFEAFVTFLFEAFVNFFEIIYL